MTPESELAAALRGAFALHREFLWGLCYRMTGSAADAEDLVQDTFERALQHPPAEIAGMRPWLSRVAINLSCDHLRRRKLQAYRGTFLPEPVSTERLRGLGSRPSAASDVRYELLESSTFAFLLALEALRPKERAVLLLRDVFDYSVREAGDALALSEPNIKTLLHRARQRMASYDRRRCLPSATLSKRTARAVKRFVLYLATDNVRGIEALLREDVLELTDPGEFIAARKQLIGREKVALFIRKVSRLAESHGKLGRMCIMDLNGMPALVSEVDPPRTDFAPRQVFVLDVDEHGRVWRIYTVLASRKLTQLDFTRLRGLNRVQETIVRAARFLTRLLQRPEQRLSKHIQVHARSRVRPGSAASDRRGS
jgi:RNA polymerase sigma-70 factor (ECF subfamily)